MALGVVPAWSGRYILDFEQVIAEVQDSATYGDDEKTEEDGGDEPHFSLITGKLVTSKCYGDRVEEEDNKGKGNADGVLVSRNQETTVGSVIGSAAGECTCWLPDSMVKLLELIGSIRSISSDAFMARA